MASVQFKSAEKASEAFGNTECQAWSVWTGKQLMYKGIGVADLDAFLDLLKDNGASNAIYTIAYYEEITDKKKINSKTAFDGSFNFRMNDEGQEITGDQYHKFYRNNEVQSRLSGLEKKFELLMEKFDSDVETETENKLGVIGEVLSHPAIAPVIPQLMQQIVAGLFKPVQQVPPRLQAVAGIGNIAEQDPRLAEVITRLLKADPKLVDHLIKLADMSENDPQNFAIVVAALEGG